MAFPKTAFPKTAFPKTAFPKTAFPKTAFPKTAFPKTVLLRIYSRQALIGEPLGEFLRGGRSLLRRHS